MSDPSASSPSVSSILSAWSRYHGAVDASWQSIYALKIRNAVDYMEHFLNEPEWRDREFIVDGRMQWTRGQLWERATTWAKLWEARAQPRPHRSPKPPVAALLMSNSPYFLVSWLSLALRGYTIALLNTSHRAPQLLHDLRTAGPDLLVIDLPMRARWTEVEAEPEFRSEWKRKLQVILSVGNGAPKAENETLDVMEDLLDALPQAAMATPHMRSAASHNLVLDTPLFHIFTSGTTGRSKAALFSHRRFIGCGIVWTAAMQLNQHDRYYNCLPLFHGNGGCVAYSACVFSGAVFIVREKFSASAFWKDIVDFKASAMVYVGEVWRYILNKYAEKPDQFVSSYLHDNPLRKIAGNGLSFGTWKSLKKAFPFISTIVEHYGMTEMPAGPHMNFYGTVGACGFAPLLASDPHLYDGLRPQLARADKIIQWDLSAGAPYRGPDGWGREVSVGQPGECVFLLARGRSFYEAEESKRTQQLIASKDHNPNSTLNPHVPLDLTSPLPKDTENPFYTPYSGYSDPVHNGSRVHRSLFEEGDAYFSTGDLLRYDEHGFLSFVDRAGDSYRVKGENVSCLDVQETLQDFSWTYMDNGVTKQGAFVELNVYGVKYGEREGRHGMVAMRFSASNASFPWEQFFQYLQQHLPNYAIPTFYRLLSVADVPASDAKDSEVPSSATPTTATHKMQKAKVSQEGFHPHDKTVFVIQPKGDIGAGKFKQLDDELYQMIMQPDYRGFEF